MALIPVTFKHSTETGKEKSGKVSTITARMLYANTFSNKVGIVKGYKKDDATDELSVSYDSSASTSTTFRLVFNKGAVSIYGGIGIIEQGTVLDIPRGLTNNSVGIRINLANPAGQEMEWYVKPSSETLQKDDLQIHDNDGVYEFELFKITTTGTAPTVTDKTTEYILSVDDFLKSKMNELGFIDGSITLESGCTATVNKLTRQGNYVLCELELTRINNSVSTSVGLGINVNNLKLITLGTIPENFEPKSGGYYGCNCEVQISTINGGYYGFGKVQVRLLGSTIKLDIEGRTDDSDGGSIRVIHSPDTPLIIKFGYEANPME